MDVSELRTAVAAVALGVINTGSDVVFGLAIPQNMRRFVYRVKFINTFAGVNQLVIGKRENGAAATTIVDYVQAAVVNEMNTDPDNLTEDSAPLYIIEGPPGNVATAATSFIRAFCSAGGGLLTLWYADRPG